MKGPVPMIGRVVGAALGGAIGKQNNENPIIGAAVGAVAMVAARKLLPARVAVLGAAVATGYVTRKLAQRAERRAAAMAAAPTAPDAIAAKVPAPAATPRKAALRKPRAPRRPTFS
jgi:predicted lipid-binding transport protein (Tim44 family)